MVSVSVSVVYPIPVSVDIRVRVTLSLDKKSTDIQSLDEKSVILRICDRRIWAE